MAAFLWLNPTLPLDQCQGARKNIWNDLQWESIDVSTLVHSRCLAASVGW